jgi:hypothetical protein
MVRAAEEGGVSDVDPRILETARAYALEEGWKLPDAQVRGVITSLGVNDDDDIERLVALAAAKRYVLEEGFKRPDEELLAAVKAMGVNDGDVFGLVDDAYDRREEVEQEAAFRSNGASPSHLPTEERPESEPHSWTPIDLIATASEIPEPPTIGGIVYPGRRHVYSGEPESLKSWAALVLCVEEMAAGRNVLYIDFNEMGRRETLERLRALGLTDDEVRERFIYIEPGEPMTDPAVLADVTALIQDRAPSLVVLDAFDGALEAHGLDPNSSVEVQRFYRTVVDPLRAGGAAELLLDHLTRDPAKRGKYSIGSQRKIGGCDVHLGFEVVKPFGRGRSGLAKIQVHKDRPGHLARPKCAELQLTSDPGTGHVTWTLAPSESEDEGATWRPTTLMERASRLLEKQTAPLSRSAIADEVKGKREYIFKAITALVAEGYASENEDGGIIFERPFREADDA